LQVTLSAFDNPGGSGVSAIWVTGNGSDPTPAATVYMGPFAVTSPLTLKYRAWDNVGNAGFVYTSVLLVDPIAPTETISCDGSPCTSSTAHGPVRVRLAATDSGGSGVAAIRYTTDGSAPNASSPRYSSAFSVSRTTTVRFRTVDYAGNSSPVRSIRVHVDVKSARR
jgi:hypothetical protein